MARKSYEEMARSLAYEKNVELDVEIDDDRDFAVELWGFKNHMSYDYGTHTSIPSMVGFGLKSRAQVWKEVYKELQNFEPCRPDCTCYE